MNSIKKYVISIIPDKVIYCKKILSILGLYIKAKKELADKPSINIHFYSNEETIDMIINHHKSISRFGDGELCWMAGMKFKSFQDSSNEFIEDLKNSFYTNNDNVLIGLPKGLYDPSGCNLFARMWWTIIKAKDYDVISSMTNPNKKYIDASLTRPYIDYDNIEFSKTTFEQIRSIWNNRDVCIIEGEKTKLGLGNDLMNNCKSIKRIICPATNAYYSKKKIVSYVKENISKDILLLGALGPTASILSVELSGLGYQFIDIGHVDVEYMWYRSKAKIKTSIPGKYVNESILQDGGNLYDDDPQYLKSIICVIR